MESELLDVYLKYSWVCSLGGGSSAYVDLEFSDSELEYIHVTFVHEEGGGAWVAVTLEGREDEELARIADRVLDVAERVLASAQKCSEEVFGELVAVGGVEEYLAGLGLEG